MTRLGVLRLGVGRLGGDLDVLPAPPEAPEVGDIRPLFSWHSPWPGIEFAAEMTLDLYLFGDVEVTGESEDVLLLVLGAA